MVVCYYKLAWTCQMSRVSRFLVTTRPSITMVTRHRQGNLWQCIWCSCNLLEAGKLGKGIQILGRIQSEASTDVWYKEYWMFSSPLLHVVYISALIDQLEQTAVFTARPAEGPVQRMWGLAQVNKHHGDGQEPWCPPEGENRLEVH